MENLQAIAAIIGFVNGIILFQTDRTAFLYFCVAVSAGLLAGFLHWFGLAGLEEGFVAGLASSGLYKSVQVLSGIKK